MIDPVPKSTLAENLAQAAIIKSEMQQLLSELEETASGQPIKKTGTWRHHPAQWAAEHLPTKLPVSPKTTPLKPEHSSKHKG